MVDDSLRSLSGSETRQRTHHIGFRCSDGEAAALTRKAERAGLSRGAYLRTVALGSPGPRAARRPVAEKVELARLLGELGRAGSNLNQLARAANCGVPPSLARLEVVLGQVEAAARAIMKALGRDY